MLRLAVPRFLRGIAPVALDRNKRRGCPRRRADLCKHVNLLDSLLDAIVRLEGDALVMHVGEKPYVVTTSEATNQFRGPLAWGQVELSTRVLTTDAVSGMLGQILPLDQRSALDEYGATEYDVTAANHAQERFTIVAARGGDDIWVEMRRHPKADIVAASFAALEPTPVPVEEPPPVMAAVEPEVQSPAVAVAIEPVREEVPVRDAVEPLRHEVEPVQEEAILIHSDVEESLELPVMVEAAPEAIEEAPAMADLAPDIGLGSAARDEAIDEPLVIDAPEPAEQSTFELDLDRELDPQPFSLDADVEAGLLAATQEWGDDVMTESELGELLRATASAVITSETFGLDSERETDVPGDVTPEHLESTDFRATAHEQPLSALPGVEIASAEPAHAAPAAVDRPVTPPGDEARVSRETQELPALVEYQIARDRVASRAVETADFEPTFFASHDAGETELVHFIENSERSVASAEGVLPVSEDLIPDNFPASTEDRHAAARVASDRAARSSGSDVHEYPEAADAVAGAPPVYVVEPVASESTADAVVATHGDEPEEDAAPARPAAVVLPLTRQAKVEGGEARATATTNLQRLLRLAANRGAATIYVVANAAPLVRVDGEFSTLEGEPAISAAVVERLLAEVSPAGRGAAPPAAEWLIDLPEIGRVRCLTFRDHRGPGIIFRMVPPRAIAADQLGLTAEVQALCSEADGLVLVTGGRGSGKSTLLASFVDLINRTRSDHIITTESQIEFVHESKRSFISQREVRGEEAMVAAVRAACREEPDVLIVEDIRSHDVATLALEAAESGRLVFASVPGLSTASAVERLIELFPVDRREKVQASLAATLRGVVSQVLLRKLRGGRVAAREVLLNTPAVASVLMEGKTFQLPGALENGRRAGMMSFADSLALLVREGTVHPSHAYRKAPNREQLLAALRRDGVDTAIAERLG